MNAVGDKLAINGEGTSNPRPRKGGKKGPHATVKFGSASVPIDRSDSKGRVRYFITHYRHGKRLRQAFTDLGTVTVGSGDSTAGGMINQTGGALTMTGSTQMIIGNGATGTTAGTAASGTYNLSGGSLTGATATTRGIILGTNNGTTGMFNLSGTGSLTLGTAILMVARSNAALTGSSGFFNQSGGTAVIGNVTVVGGSGSGSTGHLNLTGGTFSATSFAPLASAAGSNATITLGGTAQVTLPAFPTTRGADSTATLYFDGGTLIPNAASTTYLGGLTNAFIKSGGAEFNVTSGKDITVSQKLLADASSTGGGLTKSGTGKLILSGACSYTGNTTISAGTLELASSGSLKFVPTGNGISDKLTGSGTVILKGSFAIDLASAAAANGNSWKIVDVEKRSPKHSTHHSPWLASPSSPMSGRKPPATRSGLSPNQAESFPIHKPAVFCHESPLTTRTARRLPMMIPIRMASINC